MEGASAVMQEGALAFNALEEYVQQKASAVSGALSDAAGRARRGELLGGADDEPAYGAPAGYDWPGGELRVAVSNPRTEGRTGLDAITVYQVTTRSTVRNTPELPQQRRARRARGGAALAAARPTPDRWAPRSCKIGQ